MSLSEDLAWRGLIKDKTFADNTWLDTPRTFYLGIDASSDGLTIGNLAVLMLARRFIDAGWNAVLLAGGATSLVGDPGGKTQERELKSKDEIAKNVEAVKVEINKVLSSEQHQVVNNLDWLGKENLLDFLRDVGKFYSMTELMQRDFVSARMGEGGSGVSYAEFSYSLLQGYDYWYLYKNFNVELQIGASDQWGNMLSGVPLIRKKEGKEVQAMSMPLVVNKETGIKFGKSEAGAIWLNPAKISPTDFYQFWINVSDEDVEEYLKIYTLLDKGEIQKIIDEHTKNPSVRSAQAALASEVTRIVHGEEAVSQAKSHAESINTTTTTTIPAIKLKSGISVASALVETGLASSNSEARRILEDGGVYINNEPAKTETIEISDYEDGRLRLRRGKKLSNSVLVELDDA